jgi:hypothetical protein
MIEEVDQGAHPSADEQTAAPAADLDELSPEMASLPPSSLRRAREIASVLRRHGLWNLVEAFGLRRLRSSR